MVRSCSARTNTDSGVRCYSVGIWRKNPMTYVLFCHHLKQIFDGVNFYPNAGGQFSISLRFQWQTFYAPPLAWIATTSLGCPPKSCIWVMRLEWGFHYKVDNITTFTREWNSFESPYSQLCETKKIRIDKYFCLVTFFLPPIKYNSGDNHLERKQDQLFPYIKACWLHPYPFPLFETLMSLRGSL